VCSHISSSCTVCSSFSCFRGGQPIHTVQPFTFHSPVKDLTIHSSVTYSNCRPEHPGRCALLSTAFSESPLTASHPIMGGDQLLSRPTITLDPHLWL
jgi:hypothetical protein